MGFRRRLHDRSHHRGLHGHEHVGRQRRTALILIVTGLARVVVWITLIACYLLGFHFTKTLFSSVAFVALISLYANGATDWGQVAASLAQLTAGDAHADVEHVRVVQAMDFAEIESDIARLAELQPGPDAITLAGQIREKLHVIGPSKSV